MRIRDLNQPYEDVYRDPIQYTTCRDYNHISRYKGLRQVIHQGNGLDRYIALETCNAFNKPEDVTYYTVPAHLENRLDVIAKEKLGSPTYAWVLAYYNNIEDGFTVTEGTTLSIPRSVSDLFSAGQVLAPVSALKLNLGSE